MIVAPALDIDIELGNIPLNRHQRMYRQVVANLFDHLQTAGFTLDGVNDGEGIEPATTIKEAMEVIFNLDEAWPYVKDPSGKYLHTIFIVLGNDEPEDIICDYEFTTGDPDGFEAAMESFHAEQFG